MTLIRVSVLCLDDDERARVRAWLKPGPEANGDYLVGLCDEAALEQMRKAGTIFNAEAPGPEPAAEADPEGPTDGSGGAEPALEAPSDGLLEALSDAPADDPRLSGRAIVDLDRPLTPNVQKQLEDAGAAIDRRLDGWRYVLRFRDDLSRLTDLAPVIAARWYDQRATLGDRFAAEMVNVHRRATAPPRPGRGDRGAPRMGPTPSRSLDPLHPHIRFRVAPPGSIPILPMADEAAGDSGGGGDLESTAGGAEMDGGAAAAAPADEAEAAPVEVPYDLRCHDRTEATGVADRIRVLAGVKRVEMCRGSRVRYWVDHDDRREAELSAQISGFSQVEWLEPYVMPEPLVGWADAALWGRSALAPRGPWRGEGQKIAITDSGIDEQHSDFAGRVTKVDYAHAPPNRDPVGHGTHVAAIAAGAGAANATELAGIAPEAEILMQCVADANGLYTGLNEGIAHLMQDAHDAGIRIQNFSWGAPVAGEYVINTVEVDEFIAANPDHLVVVAGGNWGVQDVTDPDRRIAFKSLGAPASAKNCLTVGACCSPRPDGPYKDLKWAQYDGRQPPTFPPMANEPLTGDPNIVAALSSRGPTGEGRLKPELVAVGVGVAAARSHDRANQIKPWGTTDQYMYLSGTSMATPVVAGAALLLREYFAKQRGHAPSAALMKAALINGAQWLPRDIQEDVRVGQPNFHQGFGRLNLARVFPVDAAAGFTLTFIDVADGDAEAVQVGASPTSTVRWRRKLMVDDHEGALSITMCWTDPPGRGLQHELDLIAIAPDGTRHIGNNALVRLAFQQSDTTNNVERVTVDAPAPGEWTVIVTPFNTRLHPQGFAVAATGQISDWI